MKDQRIFYFFFRINEVFYCGKTINITLIFNPHQSDIFLLICLVLITIPNSMRYDDVKTIIYKIDKIQYDDVKQMIMQWIDRQQKYKQ